MGTLVGRFSADILFVVFRIKVNAPAASCSVLLDWYGK
jgi:hypothetical protein